MLKKGITIFFVLILVLFASSGFILKKIILNEIPFVLEQATQNGIHIHWGKLDTQTSIGKVTLTLTDIKAISPQGDYLADKIILNFSLWTPKTCTGTLEGTQKFNQFLLKSDSIPFILRTGEKFEVKTILQNGVLSSDLPLIRFQEGEIFLSFNKENLDFDINGNKISLFQIEQKELSLLETFSLTGNKKLNDQKVHLQKALFDFGTIQLSLNGSITPKSFYLDAQIHGWQILLDILEKEGKISSKQAQIARFSLNLLSVRGILSVPLIRKDGIIYVGKIPLLKE